MAPIDVSEHPTAALDEYARIPIAFEVRTVVDARGTAAPFSWTERITAAPYVKDYDALDGGPASWPRRFDLSHWRILGARVDEELVGGAAVILEHENAATLWDIRVSPQARRRGVGSALFDAAARCARERGCDELLVETQNINAAACRFYARRGCVLAHVERGAYPDLPDEVKLVWSRSLRRGA